MNNSHQHDQLQARVISLFDQLEDLEISGLATTLLYVADVVHSEFTQALSTSLDSINETMDRLALPEAAREVGRNAFLQPFQDAISWVTLGKNLERHLTRKAILDFTRGEPAFDEDEEGNERMHPKLQHVQGIILELLQLIQITSDMAKADPSQLDLIEENGVSLAGFKAPKVRVEDMPPLDSDG